MNLPITDVLGPVYEVDQRTEAAIIEMIRLMIPQKPAWRGVTHWERGWAENLLAYRERGDMAALRPRYIRDGLPLRQQGRFVIPERPDYEWLWYRKFRAQITKEWLLDASVICELGCGSGHNVAWLANALPEKLIVGADWSQSAVEIVEEMRRRGQPNVEGVEFNFYNPPPWRTTGTTFLTVGAMEQTGKNWQPMLDWLMLRKPRRVVHIEPILSMYDADNPVDAVAIEAHRARGFWEGYEDELQAMHDKGKIEIEHAERAGLGSLLTEGYSTLVWRPL